MLADGAQAAALQRRREQRATAKVPAFVDTSCGHWRGHWVVLTRRRSVAVQTEREAARVVRRTARAAESGPPTAAVDAAAEPVAAAEPTEWEGRLAALTTASGGRVVTPQGGGHVRVAVGSYGFRLSDLATGAEQLACPVYSGSGTSLLNSPSLCMDTPIGVAGCMNATPPPYRPIGLHSGSRS